MGHRDNLRKIMEPFTALRARRSCSISEMPVHSETTHYSSEDHVTIGMANSVSTPASAPAWLGDTSHGLLA